MALAMLYPEQFKRGKGNAKPLEAKGFNEGLLSQARSQWINAR